MAVPISVNPKLLFKLFPLPPRAGSIVTLTQKEAYIGIGVPPTTLYENEKATLDENERRPSTHISRIAVVPRRRKLFDLRFDHSHKVCENYELFKSQNFPKTHTIRIYSFLCFKKIQIW